MRRPSRKARAALRRYARAGAGGPGAPLAAVRGGLVVQSDALRLWDPLSQRVVRRFPGRTFVAARGWLVASCEDPCRAVHITDTRTDRHVLARVPGGYDGEFSPNGHWLVVRDEPGALALIDVADGSAEALDTRGAPGGGLLAWASSGWLFFQAAGDRIGAWRPGERARLLAATPGPFVAMAADWRTSVSSR